MKTIKTNKKSLALQPETIRRLSAVELSQVAGAMMNRTLPCSIPCTDICSSGL
jgi:hypothetical protein